MLSALGARVRIVLPTCSHPPDCPVTPIWQVLPSPFEPGMPPVGPRRVPGSGARLASLGIAEGSAAGGAARRTGSTPNMTDQLVGNEEWSWGWVGRLRAQQGANNDCKKQAPHNSFSLLC